MNVGGVVQQGQGTSSGASSDAESATAGDDDNSTEQGAVLRAGEEVLCRCQQMYVASGNDKKTLFLLCIGLNVNNNMPLLSLENEPWSRLKSSLRPKNTDYVREIVRRADLYNVHPVPRPANWKRPQIIEWLEQNPVRENDCIEFLISEVTKRCDILVRLHQQETDLSTGGGGGTKWRGTVPYLRVIMCLTDDNVKHLFLNRANARTRLELDGRNSENR
jgi:hypothetical protein